MPATFGATLTEVLMSLLIMGVGITSVFTLFPISVLRSILATQQTNGKITHLNAEAVIHAAGQSINLHSPNFVPTQDPQPPGPLNRPYSLFRGEWKPTTLYATGDIVVPTRKPGDTFPTPNLWFVQVNPGTNSGTLFSGLVEPNWNLRGSTIEGGPGPTNADRLNWQPLPYIQVLPNGTTGNQFTAGGGFAVPSVGGVPFFSTRGYVVDPLGWNTFRDEQTLQDYNGGANGFNEFGNNTNTITGLGQSLYQGTPISSPLLRLNASLVLQQAAVANMSLLDTWQFQVEATPVAANATSVTFPNNVSLTDIVNIVNLPSTGKLAVFRITLTSTDGSMSVSRIVTGATGQTISWSMKSPMPASIERAALPARFPLNAGGAPDVGSARIETFDQQYSWFLTVKKDSSGNAAVKCVVVFKRNFQPEEEHCYTANFGFDTQLGASTLDVNSDGLPDVGSNNQVRIVWASKPAGGTEPEPLLKPGNFLFDARNVEWYRIQSVAEGSYTAVLTLDRPVIPTLDTNGDGVPDPAWGRAILMRGIVNVFDL